MNWISLNSTLISAAAYVNYQLYIVFRDGSQYMYSGVPEQLFVQLIHSPSAGQFYIKQIKGRFVSQKLLSPEQ